MMNDCKPTIGSMVTVNGNEGVITGVDVSLQVARVFYLDGNSSTNHFNDIISKTDDQQLNIFNSPVNRSPTGSTPGMGILERAKSEAAMREDFHLAQKCKEEIELLSRQEHSTRKVLLCEPLPMSLIDRQLVSGKEIMNEGISDPTQPAADGHSPPAYVKSVSYRFHSRGDLNTVWRTVFQHSQNNIQLAILRTYRVLAMTSPYCTELNPELSRRAQYGADLLLAGSTPDCLINKAPPKPNSWDQISYTLGLKGCTGSLSSRRLLESGCDQSAGDVVHHLMHDISSAGLEHRRWLLSPGLREIGIGQSSDKKVVFNSLYHFSATQNVFEMGAFTAFPPPGVFPLQWVPEGGFRWSFSPNPMLYDLSHSFDVCVSVRPVTVHSEGYDLIGGITLPVAVDVSTSHHGSGSCIEFTPQGVLFENDSSYEVTVGGLVAYLGEPEVGEFRVEEISRDGRKEIKISNTTSMKKVIQITFSEGSVVVPMHSSVIVVSDVQLMLTVHPGRSIPFAHGTWSSYTRHTATAPPDELPDNSRPVSIRYLVSFTSTDLPPCPNSVAVSPSASHSHMIHSS